ncbi:MAG: hypothetical protein IJO83_03005 [Clostridia bacterium]|nr:hypothetical protein [Clostridia bacterium]
MKRTKILIAFFYILNIAIINALVKMDDTITATGLCFTYMMIQGVLVKISLLGELKNYSPKIYEKLKEDKYVNGFKWLGYAFGGSYNTTEDKNIRFCIIADMVLTVIIFVQLIILGSVL